jgi:hypothetical protein
LDALRGLVLSVGNREESRMTLRLGHRVESSMASQVPTGIVGDPEARAEPFLLKKTGFWCGAEPCTVCVS